MASPEASASLYRSETSGVEARLSCAAAAAPAASVRRSESSSDERVRQSMSTWPASSGSTSRASRHDELSIHWQSSKASTCKG